MTTCTTRRRDLAETPRRANPRRVRQRIRNQPGRPLRRPAWHRHEHHPDSPNGYPQGRERIVSAGGETRLFHVIDAEGEDRAEMGCFAAQSIERVFVEVRLQLKLNPPRRGIRHYGPVAERLTRASSIGSPHEKRHSVLGLRQERFEASRGDDADVGPRHNVATYHDSDDQVKRASPVRVSDGRRRHAGSSALGPIVRARGSRSLERRHRPE